MVRVTKVKIGLIGVRVRFKVGFVRVRARVRVRG